MQIKLMCGDCLALMKNMPDRLIDLTVTSPPYDNLRTYNGTIDQWNFEKFKAVAKELYRVTADGGVVVWIVCDATIKGSETGTSFKQALWFKECGFNLHDTMIFAKNNPMPNVNSKRYLQGFEYMFVFSKGCAKTFNALMERSKYAGQSSFGKPSVWSKDGELRQKEPRIINEFKKRTNIFYYTVGSLTSGNTSHPAVFPEQLAADHIKSWSNPGDIVFDPFMGSGTTGKMAVLNRRRFIGIELDPAYFEIAKKRISAHQNQGRTLAHEEICSNAE